MKFKIQSRRGQGTVRDMGCCGGVETGQGIDLHLYFADVGDHCIE